MVLSEGQGAQREDELDRPMGHLKKRGPPLWAGMPQLSFMAQDTIITLQIMGILNQVDTNFNWAIPQWNSSKDSQSTAESILCFLYFFTLSVQNCLGIHPFLAFRDYQISEYQKRVVFSFLFSPFTSFLFISFKGMTKSRRNKNSLEKTETAL